MKLIRTSFKQTNPTFKVEQIGATSFLDVEIQGAVVEAKSRGSAGSIVSDYGMNDRGSIPDRGRGFSHLVPRLSMSGSYTSSHPMFLHGMQRDSFKVCLFYEGTLSVYTFYVVEAMVM
jgi:hypothetical protein